METGELGLFLNNLLKISEIHDDSLNGLQVANSGSVRKVALAVDVSLAAIVEAGKLHADMLFVHHGQFWGKPVALTAGVYKRIRALMDADMALYAAHLPLDLHPELGNNAQIEKILEFPVKRDFGDYHGTVIGKEVVFNEPVSVEAIVERMRKGLNCDPKVWRFGPDKISRLGYVSGGAISMMDQAVQAGMDAYITGEPAHSAYWTAREAGIHVIFGGHYATETLGVKAVGEVIHKEFGLETVFIDLPTGY